MLPILFFLALIAIDQLTKFLAATLLRPIGTVPIINGVFSLTYVANTGAAFGILEGARWFFVVITAVVMVGIVFYYVRLPKGKAYNKARFALILIEAGAFGNFIDRARQGYVVDFLQARFIDFPVFNAADSFVVIGVILFAILYLFVYKENKTERGRAEPERL